METDPKTITIREAAALLGRSRSAIAHKIRRLQIQPLFHTRNNPGSPKGHYRTDQIRAAMVDRRYRPPASQ